MKVLVTGAGRMGMRHCLGVLNVAEVSELIVCDVQKPALDNAASQLKDKSNGKKLSFYLWEDLLKLSVRLDVIIIASTAGNRKVVCEQLMRFEPRSFLIEKPLGQSMEQVQKLVDFFAAKKDVKAFVNLNTRLYPGYQKLKSELSALPQFNGPLTFSISTGTLGIGANGIHYIDLIKYLTGAASIKIHSASVDETVIPSGRGPQFADFGGYAVLDYINAKGNRLARAFLVLSSQSTVFGPWEIVGSHGRILIDEFEQTRFNKYRKPDSELPVQRYAGDYLPIETEKFEVPFLNDLTQIWLSELLRNNSILPEISETIAVHDTMFQWLSHSAAYKNEFPIT